MKNIEVKHIVFLVIPDVTLLDVTGPYEVFTQLEELQRERERDFKYQLHTVAARWKKHIRTAGGMTIRCDEDIFSVDYPIDTLFVPGVPNGQVADYRLGKDLLQWIRQQAGAVRRLCSVCTGSFFLAQVGVLNGRRATTHWEMCDLLSQRHADISVDANSIFVRDGRIYTSAGISAGMDLALALVEEDYGRQAALEVARRMVLYLKRPGSQSQYSSVLTHQATDHEPVLEICRWLAEHLEEEITVERLAEHASMSSRNFARVFVRETGTTPGKYIERLRVETVCRYLVDTRFSLKEIAGKCGLGSQDNMRKVFWKNLKTSPTDYRKGFGGE